MQISLAVGMLELAVLQGLSAALQVHHSIINSLVNPLDLNPLEGRTLAFEERVESFFGILRTEQQVL